MKISFIGAGKVAMTFGAYLNQLGANLLYVDSRSAKSAQNMAKLTDCSYCGNLSTLVEKSDVIFITTGDSQIRRVAEDIAKLEINLKNKNFIHMSGALSSGELSALRDKGANCFSLHPLQSFADSKKALEEIRDTVFSIEGDELTSEMTDILRLMENKIIYLKEEDKVKYHISACIVSNYLITTLEKGVELLSDIGIGKELAKEALMPLIRGSLSNFSEFDAKDALTGPIKRGDGITVKSHIDALKGSDIEKLYKTLGEYTVSIARDSGLDDDKAKDILDILR